MSSLDVFVGNETIIDPDVYQLWLDGHSADGAAKIQQKRGTLLQFGATFEMLLGDIDDQYRTFKLLEHFLKNPIELSSQLKVQLTSEMQSQLIEKYYEFDLIIVREFLGRKLSTRLRNSLDEISEKTRISARSCKRQFENVKRVFKVVEDTPGSLVENISNGFLLPLPLAQQYAAVVFLSTNRFDLSKKKLAYLTFPDFVYCANVIMNSWSPVNKAESRELLDNNDADFDRDFFQDIKEVKVVLEKETMEEHKQSMIKVVRSKVSPDVVQEFESNFKSHSKSMVTIGINLIHNKELKEFFFDLFEKIIEPCRTSNWTKDELGLFLKHYKESAAGLNAFSRSPRSDLLITVWSRYMNTLTSCLLQMYHY